ncbi:MAG: peptide chain release factor N(5)-glutamine methyltransferase [Gammaproteobacteria bacterium]|nr:peptide chain release factor N(5)-glutamine methyltransferase [Gammaproteobacteria bacterium]
MSSVRDLLAEARARLAGTSPEPRLDSEVLLAFALKRERTWLFAHPETGLAEADAARFHALVQQRVRGVPVNYLTGRREFWSLALAVTPDTLIPRPETEQLVEIVLELDLPRNARVLDLGTGSGAIALALGQERPDWRLVATDRSAAALAVAAGNAKRLALANIAFASGDWFDALPAGAIFDLVVSNPPYIPDADPHLARGDLRFEPRDALASGEDGLRDLGAIIDRAPEFLRPGGWLWLEHGFDQREAVMAMLAQRGFRDCRHHADAAGNPRNSGGRWESGSRTGT